MLPFPIEGIFFQDSPEHVEIPINIKQCFFYQPVNRLSVWGKGEKIARKGKEKGAVLSLRDFFTLSSNRVPVHRLLL